jgi:hypothetical protein
MSSQEQKLNNNINELQRFVHDTRRQAIYSQGNRPYYRTETLDQYCNLLESSIKQLSRL